MSPGLARLNALPAARAQDELLRCCGSRRWAEVLAAARPFSDEERLLEAAQTAWEALSRADWLEAFSRHPRIGDKDALRRKFAATSAWAADEQAGAAAAGEELLEGLARGNEEYSRKFGYIFIVCAAGKSAAEMLALLRKRLPNDPAAELRIAAGEQAKITRLRLIKLLDSAA